MLTAPLIKAHARELGFDACGIAPAGDLPELRCFPDWIARGYAGSMAYLERSADRRADVRRVLPSARSVIVTATVYNTDRPYSTERADPSRAEIARYAWGDDYHDVIGARIQALVAPGTLDAARCISYLTIEHRGEIPGHLRANLASHVYGCDVCQEVCPWNAMAPRSADPACQH